MEFVSRYVDLKPTESGLIGRCPYHGNHCASSGVNAEGNHWHCFAGSGGGPGIDSWMRWQECDSVTAVGKLAGMATP